MNARLVPRSTRSGAIKSHGLRSEACHIDGLSRLIAANDEELNSACYVSGSGCLQLLIKQTRMIMTASRCSPVDCNEREQYEVSLP